MFNGGHRVVESFFKRHRLRRSRRLRSSFRASFIGRPRSGHRTTPTNQELLKSNPSINQPIESIKPQKVKKQKQIEIIRVEDEEIERIEQNSKEDTIEIGVNKLYQQFAKSIYPNKQMSSKLRPKTANTDSPNLVTKETTKVDLMANEIKNLKKELNNNKEIILLLKEKEKQLQDRLSEQARKQIEKSSTKFEDLSLGDNRPSQLIKRYGNLYSETRVEALDSLEELPDINTCDDLKSKLLLSIIVLSFRSSQKTLLEIKNKIKEILNVTMVTQGGDPGCHGVVKDLEDDIGVFLRKTISKFDLKKNKKEVSEKVWSTLYDYPNLKKLKNLKKYIDESIEVSWGLTVQNPPYLIYYDSTIFDEKKHTKFHTSGPDCDLIKSVLWPSLCEGYNGICVSKGVVIT